MSLIIKWKNVAAATLVVMSLSACGSKRYAVQYAPSNPVTGISQEQTHEIISTTYDSTADDLHSAIENIQDSFTQQAEPESWDGMMQKKLDSLCNSTISETSDLGVFIYDMTAGRPLFAHHARHRLRPASCQKLITCITLLDRIDGGAKLNTEVRVTGKQTEGTLEGDVYLAGDMDPMLSTDNLKELATKLHQSGIDSIAGNIYELLPTYEVLPYGWGWCWDDEYGPLAAHLVNGTEGIHTAWIDALKKAGIELHNENVTEIKSQEDATVLSFNLGHSICDVMNPLLKKSDNIYAECLFYRLAAMSKHAKTARHQAAAQIDSLITRLGLHPKDYLIADGSGLSLYNYTTPELLVTMLNHAYQTESIKQYLWACLPVAGVDGTLEHRMRGTACQGNVHAKTGTVEGVSSLSGYLTASNGHQMSFSIINQGIVRTRTGHAFQDAVCTLLCQ